MNILEGIPYNEVINSTGKSYVEFRKTLLTNFKSPWIHIAGSILVLILLFFVDDYLIQTFYPFCWLFILLFSFLIGFVIAYLNLFIHEAGHFYLHQDKKTNDILSNIFLCSWMGLDIKVYRKTHWQHHLHLGNAQDMETSYFHPLTAVFLLKTLTGVHLLNTVMDKTKKMQLNKKLITRARVMLVTGAIINSLLLVLFIYSGHWWLAVTWVFAMIIFFPFFFTLRQVIEHRDELAFDDPFFYQNPKARISRIFSNSLFSRIFGGAGFNKHMIHHWDPNVPFTSLPKIERFLLDCDRTKAIIKSSRTTYFSAFKKLFLSF